MNDDLHAVRRTRPTPVTGWADSADGRAVLDTVRTRIRTEQNTPAAHPRRRRRMLTVAAGVALTAGAGGIAIAGGLPFSTADPSSI